MNYPLYQNPDTAIVEINALFFDMDGVLVDVSRSYRRAIEETVSHFTGREIEPGMRTAPTLAALLLCACTAPVSDRGKPGSES